MPVLCTTHIDYISIYPIGGLGRKLSKTPCCICPVLFVITSALVLEALLGIHGSSRSIGIYDANTDCGPGWNQPESWGFGGRVPAALTLSMDSLEDELFCEPRARAVGAAVLGITHSRILSWPSIVYLRKPVTYCEITSAWPSHSL